MTKFQASQRQASPVGSPRWSRREVAKSLGAVAAAALDARRTLRILERRTQASDHPILLTVPETLYLKCLFFEAIESEPRQVAIL